MTVPDPKRHNAYNIAVGRILTLCCGKNNTIMMINRIFAAIGAIDVSALRCIENIT